MARRTRRVVRIVKTVGMAGALAAGALVAPAHAAAPVGAACAYRSSVSLFGAAATVRGCGQTTPPGDAASASPDVTLPPGGSATPLVAVDTNGARAVYDIAVLFGGRFSADGMVPPSGMLLAQSVGTTAVQSVALATSVGPQPFYARSVLATCTAGPAGKVMIAQLTDAVVVTSTDRFGNPRTSVSVPRTPPVNYTVAYIINNVNDHGVMVFNERIDNPDGSTTLNAAHMYLQGPHAVGDMVIGQVRCGH
jgi:hypothetical protein